jgi:hypothetical protein
LAEISVDVLTDQNRRVLEAQQAFYTRHGRYAQTVTELQHAPNAAIDLQIKTESDSSIVLRSTFRMMPEKTCSLAVRPDIGSLDGLICSHK